MNKETDKESVESGGQMLVIFREMAEGLVRLNPDSRQRIVDAVLAWFTGSEGALGEACADPTESMVVRLMKAKQQAYVDLCTKRRKAGERSGRVRRHAQDFVRTIGNSISDSSSNSMSKSNSESRSASEKSRRSVMFAPPTLDEVRVYCQNRGNNVDAQSWYDYYTANGWRVGRSAMKDWQAAVRTWERRQHHGASVARTVHAANWRETKKENLSNAF